MYKKINSKTHVLFCFLFFCYSNLLSAGIKDAKLEQFVEEKYNEIFYITPWKLPYINQHNKQDKEESVFYVRTSINNKKKFLILFHDFPKNFNEREIFDLYFIIEKKDKEFFLIESNSLTLKSLDVKRKMFNEYQDIEWSGVVRAIEDWHPKLLLDSSSKREMINIILTDIIETFKITFLCNDISSKNKVEYNIIIDNFDISSNLQYTNTYLILEDEKRFFWIKFDYLPTNYFIEENNSNIKNSKTYSEMKVSPSITEIPWNQVRQDIINSILTYGNKKKINCSM